MAPEDLSGKVVPRALALAHERIGDLVQAYSYLRNFLDSGQAYYVALVATFTGEDFEVVFAATRGEQDTRTRAPDGMLLSYAMTTGLVGVLEERVGEIRKMRLPYVSDRGEEPPFATYRPADPIELARDLATDEALGGCFSRHGEQVLGPAGALLIAASDWTHQRQARAEVARTLAKLGDHSAGEQRRWCEALAGWMSEAASP
jgi:hypothetical protein